MAGIKSVPKSMHNTNTVDTGGGIWRIRRRMKGKI
jgi:hypothetical protein